MRRLLRVAITAVVVSLGLATAGCGVPVEQQPHPVQLPGRANGTGASQTPAPPGELIQTLYLIKDGHLVAVTRAIEYHLSAAQQLSDLLAGPNEKEQQQGLSSALLGTDLGLSVNVRNGEATVELATNLDGTGRTDDILAFAQIVCTLTSRPDIHTVTFTRAGEQVDVPRADSSLTRSPLTADDYANLITSR